MFWTAISSKIVVADISFDFCYIILDFLFLILFTDEQDIFGIHDDKIIEALKDQEFAVGGMDHAAGGIDDDYIFSCYGIVQVVSLQVFIGAGPGTQVAPSEGR